MVWPFYAFFLLFTCGNQLQSQKLHSKIHFGAFFYQGDLSPRPIDMSFGPGNICWGISPGINVFDWLSINGRFMMGKISGSDAYAQDPQKRARNLSFASSLYEYGIYTDLKVNKIWKSLDKYKLRLYVTAGFNLIHFNPKANYKGKWIELQPLGTEGQLMASSGKKKYSLYNFSRPLGIIVEFDITKNFAFGMEVSPRKTWTDYLDDVSGSYVNYDEMVSAGNQTGAYLSNRMGEYLNTEPVRVPSGTSRGKSDKNDWYTHFGMYFKYTFIKNIDESEMIEMEKVVP